MLLRISSKPLLDLSATSFSKLSTTFFKVVCLPKTFALVSSFCSEKTVFKSWVGSTTLLLIESVFTCSLKDSSSTWIGSKFQVNPISLFPSTVPTLAFMVLIAESNIKMSIFSNSNLLSKSWLALAESIGPHRLCNLWYSSLCSIKSPCLLASKILSYSSSASCLFSGSI